MDNIKDLIKSDRIPSSKIMDFVKKYKTTEEELYATLIELAYEKGREDERNNINK